MQVKDVMHRTSLKFYESEKVEHVLDSMVRKNIKGGLVYNHFEALVGIITIERMYQSIVEKCLYLSEVIYTDFKVIKEVDPILEIEFGSSACNPVIDQSGNITGFLTRDQYLTAYTKGTQVKLSYYDAIFDSAHNGILSIDSLGKITSINPPAVRMANTIKEQAIGKFLTDIVLPTGLLEVVRTGKGHTEKYQAGNRMYISNRSPIIQDGKVVGAVGVFQDISEIDFVSNELKSVKEIVNELNVIINHSSDGICVLNHEYSIKRMNDQFKKMIQIQSEKCELPEPILNLIQRVAKDNEENSLLYKDSETNNSLIVTCTPVVDHQSNLERIVIHVKDMTEMEKLRDALEEARQMLSDYNLQNVNGFIYRSESMDRLMKMVTLVAKTDATVLLTGESGVGKGEVANLIKSKSLRRNQPFIKVNCAAIPASLIESELFGYEPGAFTGASPKGKRGYFEQANKGTIFLDEIGELSLNLQVKLLSVLQDGEITRVGAENTQKVNVRVITATNRNLTEMVKNGEFREDLYYRLNVMPLLIPPLRDRLEDIPVLVEHYSEAFSKQYNKQMHFTDDAIKALMKYKWPGNVRELVNIIERSFIISNTDRIDENDVFQLFNLTQGEHTASKSVITVHDIVPLKKAVNLLEKKLIMKALDEAKTYRKVAELLEVNVSTISRKMKHIEKEMNINE